MEGEFSLHAYSTRMCDDTIPYRDEAISDGAGKCDCDSEGDFVDVTELEKWKNEAKVFIDFLFLLISVLLNSAIYLLVSCKKMF